MGYNFSKLVLPILVIVNSTIRQFLENKVAWRSRFFIMVFFSFLNACSGLQRIDIESIEPELMGKDNSITNLKKQTNKKFIFFMLNIAKYQLVKFQRASLKYSSLTSQMIGLNLCTENFH